MKTYCTNFSRLIPGAAALLCTAGVALGQAPSLSTSGLTGSSTAGTDAASCGGILLTQNTNPDTVAAGTVSCNAGGVNTDNFYARNYPIAAPIFVKCVDFGVETNSAATNVRVRLYTSPNAGTPVTANLTMIAGSEMQVAIPANASLSLFSATYAGSGIAVPAGNLVVELFTPCRQTTCTPPGDGGSIFLGSNGLGQTAPSYIKAAACGLTDYGDLAGIGFPNVHIVQRLGTFGADPCQIPLPACRADVAGPSNGPPDGLVNVSDLLTVINTWGQTQVPPGTGPRPKGDCDPLPNGNCLVNVSDLLTVINAWGACPCEQRACCFANGTCQLLCQTACTTAGGNWQAAGSNCSPNNCPVLPPNDECGGAITVNNGPNNITNVGATNSAGIPGGACIFGGAANISKDVWFKYTATCTGIVQVDLCATTGGVTDTTLQVYSGSCGSLTEVACDDDACTNNPAGDLSKATFNATSGTQYYIRVGVWGTNTPGPMVLTISCSIPNNDFCDQASPIAIGGNANGDLATATQDSAPSCQGVTVGRGRWYTVSSPTGQTLTASTCASALQFWDLKLSVYCGASCSSLFCVAGANSDSCNGFNESVSWCAAPNQTYWILVHTDDVDSPQTYNLAVTGGAACNNPVLCGTPGDECGSALGPLMVGANNVDNTGMTTSADTPCNTITLDAWYNFTAPSSGPFTFSLCGGTGDTVLALYSGACSALTQVACDDDGCGTVGSVSVLTANLTAGTQYKVRYGFWSNSGTGPNVLNITAAAGCGTCSGTSEGAPCRVDGDAPASDPNGGCNSTPPMFGLPGNTPITLGQVICGIGSYYTTGGAGYRDTDWYLFTPATNGNYDITVCAEFPVTVGFVTNGTTNVQTCAAGGTAAFVPGVANFPAFTESIATSTLTAGTTYALFVAPQQGLGTLACSNYRVKVTTGAPPPPPPANDSCANAVTVGANSATAGTTVNATPAAGPDSQVPTGTPSCQWAANPSTYHNTVWYKFVATAATARVHTCATTGTAIDTLVGVYSGTCGALVQKGCGEDECAAGAAPYYSDTNGTGGIPVTGLVVGQTYYISVGMPGGWTGEVAGPFMLTVVSP